MNTDQNDTYQDHEKYPQSKNTAKFAAAISTKEDIRKALEYAKDAHGSVEIAYIDYTPNQWSVPVKITPERITSILDDASVTRVRILIDKPA